MIQFGLSLFLKREGEDGGYDAKTYNFYTFQQLDTGVVIIYITVSLDRNVARDKPFCRTIYWETC